MEINNIPTLDLHGESREIAIILANDFINDNYKLGKKEILIIHGIGKGIIKKAILDLANKNKLVNKYYYNFFNIGCIYIELKEKSKNN